METRKVNIAGVMTAPRYEAVVARNSISQAFERAGIPLMVSGGVFYGQCMQRMLRQLVEIGTEVVVTVDFDSMITRNDIDTLIQTLVNDDSIHAIAALQARRGMKFPLMTRDKETEIRVTGPIEVTTAHFGLTAIKLDRLAAIPKPWFWSAPDENGDWEGAKVDDDIYFWKKWREHGNSIYVHPFVSIGHLEELVAVYEEHDGMLEHRWVYPNDWYAANLKN